MAPAFRFRADIDSLPAYVPGQRPPAGHSTYKLSSNENPFPPSAAVLAAVADAAADLNRYPDMYATELVAAIAAHLGTEPDRVAVGNGSVAVLETVLKAACRPGDEVVHAWRSFEAYPIAIQVAGATGVRVPVREDGSHDLVAMADAITDRTRVVLVCSPNNPTGTVVHDDEMWAFLARVPRGVLVVMDEAYVEFVRDDDAADGLALAAEFKNVLVLRTFSKAYGLAGLRVGYAVARPRLIRGLRSASTPFGVNALAQAAALTVLREAKDVAVRCERIIAERTRVLAALRETGWTVPEAQGNFYWLEVGRHAVSFAREAAASGAVVRAFDGEGVRVSVGEIEGNDSVLRLAAQWQRMRVS
ncbi:histidinol-phosphate transaminase [Georgenia sp. H159]|uniref:histidinol-phosphate transaminase n=1 Tax=Georgenia sp. H159 TaxID=3076115 RepID=UPI002D781492|nr:histidinol-phosphate transaminase [Georgenia sp. H159]